MWNKIKQAALGLTEELGVEIPQMPELPVDLAAVTDSVTAAAGDVMGAGADTIDAASAGVTDAVADLGTTASDAVATDVPASTP